MALVGAPMTAADAWELKHDRERQFGIGWEMAQMLAEMDAAVIDVVLEIGTFQGDSLRVWRELLNPLLLIGVQDTDETAAETIAELGAVLVRGKSQEPDTYSEVMRCLTHPHSHKPGSWRVDMLYIDGDHTYDAAKRDWELYSQLVRPGGIIVLHDAVIEDNPTVDVYRLYRELREGRRSKLIYAGLGSTGTAVFFP